jgi:methionyl-tRNA formyltransferase
MPEPLRIVSFNVFKEPLDLVCDWVEHAGHQLVLVVTSAGPKTRRSEGYKQIAATAGERNIELLSTTRMKSVATPVLAALKPDLIISIGFPWLLPPGLLATARIGAVNMHPSLLPAYRGPNIFRQFYDGAPRIGATLHWIAEEFDTGNILAQHSVPRPERCTPEAIRAAWFPTWGRTLFEGAAKAIAGDPGRPQPAEGVSYGGQFTDEECWLDLGESADTLQCKVTGLNLLRGPHARARIGEEVWLIERLDPVESHGSAAPGSVLKTTADGLIVQTGSSAAILKAARV